MAAGFILVKLLKSHSLKSESSRTGTTATKMWTLFSCRVAKGGDQGTCSLPCLLSSAPPAVGPRGMGGHSPEGTHLRLKVPVCSEDTDACSPTLLGMVPHQSVCRQDDEESLSQVADPLVDALHGAEKVPAPFRLGQEESHEDLQDG